MLPHTILQMYSLYSHYTLLYLSIRSILRDAAGEQSPQLEAEPCIRPSIHEVGSHLLRGGEARLTMRSYQIFCSLVVSFEERITRQTVVDVTDEMEIIIS